MPTAPARPCNVFPCPNLQPCAKHARPARWHVRQSPKRNYNSPEYRQNRLTRLQMASYRCEVIVDGKRCNRPTNVTDHVDPRGDDSVGNLEAKCAAHHARKTRRERG